MASWTLEVFDLANQRSSGPILTICPYRKQVALGVLDVWSFGLSVFSRGELELELNCQRIAGEEDKKHSGE